MTVQNKRYFGLAMAVALGVATVAMAGVAPIATFSGDAVVTVNGKPITQSQPAFAGDTVEAPGGSMAVIRFPDQGMASLSSAARASVEQSGKQLWVGLQRGFVGVHEGGQPITVRAHGGKIAADSGAVFQVAQVKDVTYVTVVKGSATISEGGLDEPQVVQQGQSYQVAFLEPGPALPMAGGSSAGSGAPQAAGGKDTTCSDMKANCSKDATTCKAYAARCNVCQNPCKSGGTSQACTDFKALEAKCTPLRKACAKDQTKCTEYGSSCQALAGCKGYGGVLEMSSGAAAAGGAAAASGAAAAASAGAAAGAASATAITAAVAAASAGAAVAGAAAAGGFSNNSCTATASTTCP